MASLMGTKSSPVERAALARLAAGPGGTPISVYLILDFRTELIYAWGVCRQPQGFSQN
jgi:hypothetical protein